MEIESNDRAVGGLPEPDPREGRIRAQNATRIARRRQAANLANEVARVEGADLDRFGDRRRVGGRFQKIQRVPEREAPEREGLGIQELSQFLSAFNFGKQRRVLGSNNFLSSFGPNILGLNRPAPVSIDADADDGGDK